MILATNPQALVVPIWSGEGRATTHWQPSLDAHCLIVGGQDIDRAVAIGELVTRFVDVGYRVWVGGGHQVSDARTWPQRDGDEPVVYATSTDDQIDMLRAAHAEMLARYQADPSGERSHPPLMVVIADFSVVAGSLETISELAPLARGGDPSSDRQRVPARRATRWGPPGLYSCAGADGCRDRAEPAIERLSRIRDVCRFRHVTGTPSR